MGEREQATALIPEFSLGARRTLGEIDRCRKIRGLAAKVCFKTG